MKIDLRKTKDGSNTLYVEELDEHYHSYNGALSESEHIFINAGFKQVSKDKINILELGFGTGLNSVLTHTEAKKLNKLVYYCGIELHPLDINLIKQLNYDKLEQVDTKIFEKIHSVLWHNPINISDHFILNKVQGNILELNLSIKFDLVYFDAFAPEVHPELWKESVFTNIYNSMNNEGILLTYSAKGIVKQALRAAGFVVKRLPGPPGKRHILRASKINKGA